MRYYKKSYDNLFSKCVITKKHMRICSANAFRNTLFARVWFIHTSRFILTNTIITIHTRCACDAFAPAGNEGTSKIRISTYEHRIRKHNAFQCSCCSWVFLFYSVNRINRYKQITTFLKTRAVNLPRWPHKVICVFIVLNNSCNHCLYKNWYYM